MPITVLLVYTVRRREHACHRTHERVMRSCVLVNALQSFEGVKRPRSVVILRAMQAPPSVNERGTPVVHARTEPPNFVAMQETPKPSFFQCGNSSVIPSGNMDDCGDVGDGAVYVVYERTPHPRFRSI